MRCCCSPRAGCCLGAAVPRRYTISPRGLSRALQLDCTVAGQVIADDMLDQVVRAMPLLFLPLALPTLNWLVLSAVPTWANFPLTLSLALLCPGCHEVNIGRARARVSPSCNADRPSPANPTPGVCVRYVLRRTALGSRARCLEGGQAVSEAAKPRVRAGVRDFRSQKRRFPVHLVAWERCLPR